MSLVAVDQLCFAILVNHLDPPTFAHIHRGAAGTNGPIEVTLFPGPVAPPTTGDPGLPDIPQTGSIATRNTFSSAVQLRRPVIHPTG